MKNKYRKSPIPSSDLLIQDTWINSYASERKERATLVKLFSDVVPVAEDQRTIEAEDRDRRNSKKKGDAPALKSQVYKIFASVARAGRSSPFYPDWAEMCAKVLWRAAIYPEENMKQLAVSAQIDIAELKWENIANASMAIAVSHEWGCVITARRKLRNIARKRDGMSLRCMQREYLCALRKARISEKPTLLGRANMMRPGVGSTDGDVTVALLAILCASVVDRSVSQFADIDADLIVEDLTKCRRTAKRLARFEMKRLATLDFGRPAVK